MDRLSEPIPFEQTLLQQKDLAREHLAAAWREHIGHVERQLQQGWDDTLSRAFEERLQALAEGLESEFQRRLSVRQAELRAQAIGESNRTRQQARQELAEHLRQTVRRMAAAEGTAAWISALLDGVRPHARKAVLFSVTRKRVHLTAARRDEFDNGAASSAPNWEAPLNGAPALQTVAETRDTVVCAAAPGELSAELCALLELDPEQSVFLVPILSGPAGREKADAILLLEPVDREESAEVAEILAAVAGATHQARLARGATAPGTLVGIAAAAETPPAADGPVDPLERRAVRFARTKVAEMLLFHSRAVVDGRVRKDLYLSLRDQIDKGRVEYAAEFLRTPGLSDYLHVELIHTLAQDDPTLLGPDYPGPLA
jgi:hypothetical protein